MRMVKLVTECLLRLANYQFIIDYYILVITGGVLPSYVLMLDIFCIKHVCYNWKNPLL